MYVHFIDTSVFLNIVNVPGRNQQREEVLVHLSSVFGKKVGDFIKKRNLKPL